jgi:DNA-binding FadR family transcriptional regulator
VADNDPARLTARPVQSAPQQISSAVEQWILDGTLRPGDRLPSEEQMATMFGVSRPTVREALRDLRAAHLLSSERGRTGGYSVTEMSVRTLGTSVAEVISLSLRMQTLSYAQLFEVRLMLELQAAAAAAERRTDDDMTKLQAALDELLALPADPEEVLSRDLVFHRVLAESTHNPLIIGFAGATTTAFRRFTADVHAIASEQMVAHLDEVVAAVAARDPDAARAAMQAHLDYFARYFGIS